jgi:hypothetical protein
VDASLGQARRFCDLLLSVPLLDRVSDQSVSLGMQLFGAADFVPYLAKLGQRVLACHSISSRLRALLFAIGLSVRSTVTLVYEPGLPDRIDISVELRRLGKQRILPTCAHF